MNNFSGYIEPNIVQIIVEKIFQALVARVIFAVYIPTLDFASLNRRGIFLHTFMLLSAYIVP